MRTVIPLKDQWMFSKEGVCAPITLPHTWNAVDGADGGNDYYRGTCVYTRQFNAPRTEPGDLVYLEFLGVNASAKVYVGRMTADIRRSVLRSRTRCRKAMS